MRRDDGVFEIPPAMNGHIFKLGLGQSAARGARQQPELCPAQARTDPG
jgi:hypothetical protein